MGEVYRARDARLHREVAIKVLPADARSDPARRERFVREAQAVAALSHPHIGALHDIGEQNGTAYLVLELVEGRTLADRLAEGPLPVDEALAYAGQIATALDHAHRHGIVHRDLKPQNVMIAKSGIKLLDFGLARLVRPIEAVAGSLPTSPATLTAEGTLLGTLPYMAPEQLEGREVDARADVFALGAVIYEMVAGRRAFDGTSPASIIGAVLRSEPPPLTGVRPVAPAALQRLVSACLEKDADRRLCSAHDAAIALQWIAADMVTPVARQAHATPRRARALAGALALATLTAVAGVALGLWLDPGGTPDPDPVQLSIAPPPDRRILEAVISPDARHVVVTASDDKAQQHLWLHTLATGTARELAGTADASHPFWSPDSRAIAFFSGGRLKRLDIDTGTVLSICEAANGRGGTWSQGGVILFTPTQVDGIFKVHESGGTPTPVTSLHPPITSHRWPHFLADGDRFLYLAFASQDANRSELRVASLSRPEGRSVLPGATEGRYADGFLFFARESVLLAQPFDPESLALRGDARVIAKNPLQMYTGRFSFSASRSGVVVYRTGELLRDTFRLTWFARDGRVLGTIGDPGQYSFPAVSPDGQRVVVSRAEAQDSARALWLFESPRWAGTRLTTAATQSDAPVWSPDGRRIAHVDRAVAGGGTMLKLMSLDEAASSSSLYQNALSFWSSAWAPDGSILLQMNDAHGRFSLWTTSAGPKTTAAAFKADRFNYGNPSLSPDGRWVAYVSDESGQKQIFIDTFPVPRRHRLVPGSTGGREPRWRRDGREIFFISASGMLTAVTVGTGDPPPFGDPETLFHWRVPPDVAERRGAASHYDVARDGRFLVSVGETQDRTPTQATTISLGATRALRASARR